MWQNPQTFRQRLCLWKENAFFSLYLVLNGWKLTVYLVLDRHSNKLRVQGGHVCACVCDLVSQPKACDIVLKCDMTVWLKYCALTLLVKIGQKRRHITWDLLAFSSWMAHVKSLTKSLKGFDKIPEF